MSSERIWCVQCSWVGQVSEILHSLYFRQESAGRSLLPRHPGDQKKKKRLRHRFYTWLCSLDSHPCLLLYTYIHSFEGLYCSRHLEQFQMFLTAFWIVFIYEWNITYGSCCLAEAKELRSILAVTRDYTLLDRNFRCCVWKLLQPVA